MKIGIDARMLGPECGGLGRYIEQLVLRLHDIDRENQYVLFLKKENWDHIALHHENFRKVLADVPWYGWDEQFRLPRIIKAEGVDIMHFPHWNVPLSYTDPFVVTIHDLLLMHYPTREASLLGPLSYWFKHHAYRRVLSHATKDARHIFTPSEFTRRDIHNMLGIPFHKMTVTYEAPFDTSKMKRDREADGSIFETHGITKPYALYVGVAYPHKNLKGLLDAWHAMEKKYGEEFQLVLVGKDNFFYKKIKAYNRLHHSTKSAIFTGFVTDEDLHLLYSRARMYAFPSLYEGFGLPPLEAMLHNVPVVSSNRTCLPEILGEGALYADPENRDQFAEAMHTVLTNEDLRFELKAQAKKELSRYSWTAMAKQTLHTYVE